MKFYTQLPVKQADKLTLIKNLVKADMIASTSYLDFVLRLKSKDMELIGRGSTFTLKVNGMPYRLQRLGLIQSFEEAIQRWEGRRVQIYSGSPGACALGLRLRWITESGFSTDIVQEHDWLARFASAINTTVIGYFIAEVWKQDTIKDDSQRFQRLYEILCQKLSGAEAISRHRRF